MNMATTTDSSALPSEVDVAIVGSGFSGLCMAIKLREAGMDDFIVLERGEAVGGTWWFNTYPGCGCDVPSHLYSFSFAPNPDWSRTYSKQGEIEAYLQRVARDFDLGRSVALGTTVTGAEWDEDARRWHVATDRGDVSARVLVSAAGALSDPKTPEIEGLDRFQGHTFHSAQWDHDAPLDGARVAVIGTGASSVQFTPEIAPRASQLFLFQRTPPWLGPSPDYHDAVPDGQRWLYAHVPTYSEWNRFWMFWRMGDGSIPGVRVDPDWDSSNGTISAVNDLMRTMFVSYLEREFADRPDLVPHVVPTYPPGAKRLLRDNGVWAGALTRDNVTLVTDEIREITPTGIVTADGSTREVDAIVVATGFHTTEQPIAEHIKGRDGRTLADAWREHGQAAYKGTTIAGFPNLFQIVGPNTGLGHSSMVFIIESQIAYIVSALQQIGQRELGTVEPTPEAQQSWNDDVQRRMQRTVWNTGGCASWYLDSHGRNTTLWPRTTFKFRELLSRFDLDQYVVTPRQDAPTTKEHAA